MFVPACGAPMRPLGLSAFVRCRNEEEYIVASVVSSYRIFDEIVVALNHSTDGTRGLLEDLASDRQKIRILEYPEECAPIGAGYGEAVAREPRASLARFYNWCLEQTTFSHVCKWDGDMIAIPPLERVREHLPDADVIMFDGWDALGEHTTDLEPRVFRFDPKRARYVDWDLYEVLDHNYTRIARIHERCYVHMKLAKRDWLHKAWANPNLLATREFPQTGGRKRGYRERLGRLLRRAASRPSGDRGA